jgi:hypothetical protein
MKVHFSRFNVHHFILNIECRPPNTDQEHFEHFLHFINLYSLFLFDIRPVRMEGLEPPCLAALDPKSNASTNFATSALLI